MNPLAIQACRLMLEALAAYGPAIFDLFEHDDKFHKAHEAMKQAVDAPEVKGTWPQALADQIKWANDRGVQAEDGGDSDGAEAWYGYVNALRWIEAQWVLNQGIEVKATVTQIGRCEHGLATIKVRRADGFEAEAQVDVFAEGWRDLWPPQVGDEVTVRTNIVTIATRRKSA